MSQLLIENQLCHRPFLFAIQRQQIMHNMHSDMGDNCQYGMGGCTLESKIMPVCCWCLYSRWGLRVRMVGNAPTM